MTFLARTLSADIAQMRRHQPPAYLCYGEVKFGSSVGGRHPGSISPAARFAVLDRGFWRRLLTALPRREPQNTSYSPSREQPTHEGARDQTFKHIRNSWKTDDDFSRAYAVNPPRSAFCRGGRRGGCTPTRNGRPFPGATSDRSCRLSSVLRTSEGSTSPRFAHDWQAPLLAGALQPRTEHCRVRDILWNFDTSPRGCSQGQRRRAPHRQRIRANEDSAGAPKPFCRRSVRFGGNSRRRRAGNTCPRSARTRSILFSSTERRISIRPYSLC